MKILHKMIVLLLFLFSSILTLQSIDSAERNITKYAQDGLVVNLDSLTTAGTSTDTLRLMSTSQIRYGVVSFSITVSGINTDSTYQKITLRIVGGQSKSKMGNLNSDGTDIEITSNGVYNFNYSYAATTDYYAVILVSRVGGTPKMHLTMKAG